MTRKTARRAAVRPGLAEGGDGLQSLQTAFRILDELSNANGPMALTDLAAALGELKPRIYRHLSTMKQLGIVSQEARNGGYSLGGRLFTLGDAALEQFDLRSVAQPYLTQLRDQTQQTALLSVPGSGEPVVLSCVEYRDRLSISSRPGNRAPPHCSSQGRVALAFVDEATRSPGHVDAVIAWRVVMSRPLIVFARLEGRKFAVSWSTNTICMTKDREVSGIANIFNRG